MLFLIAQIDRFVTLNTTQKKRSPLKSTIIEGIKKNCQELSVTFPQVFRISKNIGHPTSGSGGKKTVKKRPKKVKKKTFFCAAILDNFQTQMFICETTSFHYFSPRIPNL